jgi:hypothetical protein
MLCGSGTILESGRVGPGNSSEIWLRSHFQTNRQDWIYQIFSEKGVYNMLYKCKLFFFIVGIILNPIVKNNFLFSQHDTYMYFSPNPHSKETHGQRQHPVTSSSLWGNGSWSFSLCLFTSRTAFPWTRWVGKVIPLFHHHLWCTPMLTPNRSCSLQPSFPHLLTYSIRAPSG